MAHRIPVSDESAASRVPVAAGWKAVGSLPDGPLDLVGDIHGEHPALEALMARLGYAADGAHPGGRRLIFLGDLIDRGPDSPGVVRRVADLVDHGHALTLMGNHDLNAVAHREKNENTWLLGHGPVSDSEKAISTARERDEILDFLRLQPLALERDDLRVVHAFWDDEAFRKLMGESDPASALHKHEEQIEARFVGATDDVARKLALQNENPMKLITSGPEVRAPEPFFAGGKWRNEARHPWWSELREGPLVVVGHYWRIPIPGIQKDDGLFAGTPLNSTLGAGRAMCIDYSVGGRFDDRRNGRANGPFAGRLAALRWPERMLVFDDGEGRPLVDPSGNRSEAFK